MGLSTDGNIVAIGGHNHNGAAGSQSGNVKIYEFDGSSWNQLGQTIEGEVAGEKLGATLEISDDGTIVVIGCIGYSSAKGRVRVFQYNGTSWVQMGGSIDGAASGDNMGNRTAISSNGNIIAVGSPKNDGNGSDSGLVQVYEYNGTDWVQVGQNILGRSSSSNFGAGISINNDGTIVAAGGYGYNTNTGYAAVYQYDGSSWVQLGDFMDGEKTQDWFGSRISLNSAGNILSVGALQLSNRSGYVKTYYYDGSSWNQIGDRIMSTKDDDRTGTSVFLSASGGSLVIGSNRTDYNGTNSGSISVYEIPTTMNIEGLVTEEDFTTMTTKAEPEVEVNNNTNRVKFNSKFFNKFTRPTSLAKKREQTKNILRQILSKFSANIGTNKLIVAKEDVDLPHIFDKPNIRVVNPSQLTNNKLNVSNDLASDEGFYVDLVNENDEITLENTDGSSVKIVKLADDNYKVTETDENGTAVEFTESANYSGRLGQLYYSLGSVSGETSTESATSEISRHWEFRNSTLNNSDVINNVDAMLVNFSETDFSGNGIEFDGTSKYIDLGSNTITVGNDDSIGSGFSFETYVKSLKEGTPMDFRKIRVRRVAEQVFTPHSDWINLIHIAEIQLWINGSNVALNGTVESSSFFDSRYVDTNVIDNEITGFVDAIWHSDYYDGDYDFISVVLPQNYGLTDVESVVVYSPTHSSQDARDDMMKGCVIELLDENNNIVVSTPTITVGKRYFRFDGPAISNVNTFSPTLSTTAIVEIPLTINSSNQVSVISNMNLWTTRNFISADGQYMVVSTLGSHADNPDGGEVLYYSQDGGVTWQLSTINDDVKTIGGIRNGSITANGQYSCFHDTNMNNGVYVYYSSDYCQTYDYAGKTVATYYGSGPYINESGTIMILGSVGTNSPYHDLHIGYVNQTTLSDTTWTILNVSGLDTVGGFGFCGNADFTHILLGTSTGTFVFNNSDTSKLTNASYWSRSSNSNVSNIYIRNGYSSLDNKVIVLVNYTQNTQQIWFSTDYGSFVL